MGKFSGGSASRAEVYGLFISAVVLIGGGIGGAVAATGGFTQPSPSPSPSVSEAAPVATQAPTQSSNPSPASAAPAPPPVYNPDPTKVELPKATTPPVSETFVMPNIVGTSYRVSSDYLLNTVGLRGGFNTSSGCFGLAPFEIREQSPAAGATVNKNQAITVVFQSGMIPCVP